LIVQFEEAAQAQPKTEPAAQARFLGAELAWLSFERFGQPPDAQKAKALARRVVRDCPRCESTPGAQVLIGRALIAEGQPDEAYRELMKVELNFPRSQERVTARSLMTALRSGRTPPPEPDKPQGQATGQAPAAGAAKPPEKAPAPDPAQTPPTSPAKGQAPALAQKPLATRRPKVEHPPLPPARPDGKAQVYALNLVDYGPYQEVVAYVDQSTPYVYNLLPPTAGGRFRVYADLKGARLYPKIQANLKKSTDLVKLVKISQLTEDATRLVADLPEALAYRPLLLGNPTRLVIQVAKEAKDLPPPEPEAPPAPPP
jgi:hypothetical protein